MKLDRGKIAVLAMLALAVAAAAFAWWWNYRRGERCLALYGSEAAALVRTAPSVEILEVEPAAGPDFVVTRKIDITGAPGLLNARAALLDDASFDWDAPPPPPAAGETRLVRFAAGPRQTLLRFSSRQRSLEILPGGKSVVLDQKTSDGWRQFLERYP